VGETSPLEYAEVWETGQLVASPLDFEYWPVGATGYINFFEERFMGKAVIVYWSGTGNTEAMAKAIEKGLKDGGAEVTALEVDKANAGIVDGCDLLALGCPAMGDEVLEEDEFEPFFASLCDGGKLSGKKVALFGPYDWGEGQWMRDWQKRTADAGAKVFEDGFIQQGTPDEGACTEFGKRFAAF
jgi:flavodoxin short chain